MLYIIDVYPLLWQPRYFSLNAFGVFCRRGKKGFFMAVLDPLENNLFDLPDYENTEDETFPPLPPPASPGRDDAEWAQANGGEHPGPLKIPF